MRKYSWTRNGMRQDQDEGSYVHTEDAQAVVDDLSAALRSAADELQRLRDVLLPHYEDKIAEPDSTILEAARAAIARAEGGEA